MQPLFRRVVLFESGALKGHRLNLKPKTCERPIEYKYREGQMKRTLERELTVPKIAEGKAVMREGNCKGLMNIRRNSCLTKVRVSRIVVKTVNVQTQLGPLSSPILRRHFLCNELRGVSEGW